MIEKVTNYRSALLSIAKLDFQACLLIMIFKHDVVGGGKLAKWQLEVRGKLRGKVRT
jgi:hypothetical protein